MAAWLWALQLLTLSSATKNPFLKQTFYINPANYKEYDVSIDSAKGKVAEILRKMQAVPSAYWIDQKAKIRGNTTRSVEGILKDASSKSPPELVVLMWYDLPNRDCDAKASNGEICCKKNSDGTCDYLAVGDCADGIHEYKTGYVDPFVEVLSKYHEKLQVVLVMEPDGLANLATNIAYPNCGNKATQTAYKKGVKYAVEEITEKAPKVGIYLDAAHGGWLGWENNLGVFMKTLKGMELPFHKIRGFATNVANYQALGIQCPWCPDQGYRNGYCMNGRHKSDPCCEDPCALLSQWNFGNNELNYAQGLVAAADAELGMKAHVIIDTGRNGVVDQRGDCANWCNPRGAGTGVPSTVNTANTSLVDAYFWLKTPGESDGCTEMLPTGKSCPRYDLKCGSLDSIGSKPGEPRAVEAGTWFDFQVKQLAENANFQPPTVPKTKAKCPANPNQPPPPPPVPVLANGSQAAASSACAAAYKQCGGQGWSGPNCCQVGCDCVDNGGGGYYSQCTPKDMSDGTCGPQPTVKVSSAKHSSSRTPATSSQGGAETRLPTTSTVPTTTTAAPAPWGIFSPLASLLGIRGTPAPLATLPPLPTLAPLPTLPPLTSSTPALTVLASAPRPPKHSPAAPPTPAPVGPGKCALPYGQCGGPNWKGPTCCDQYCSCQSSGNGKSECLPQKQKPSPAKSTMSVILKDDMELPERLRPVSNMAWRWSAVLPAGGGALLALGVLAALMLRAGHRSEVEARTYEPLAPQQLSGLEPTDAA